MALGALLVAVELACSKTPPAPTSAGVKITDIEVGRGISGDKTISDKTTSFQSSDTVYVAVKTDGSAASATLTARWTYQDGQLVSESNQTIAPTGTAVSEFHVSKPDGWPKGRYRVEVLLNGASSGTKDFNVS
jgi:hypothetical protein